MSHVFAGERRDFRHTPWKRHESHRSTRGRCSGRTATGEWYHDLVAGRPSAQDGLVLSP
jgi:hypothetical protein